MHAPPIRIRLNIYRNVCNRICVYIVCKTQGRTYKDRTKCCSFYKISKGRAAPLYTRVNGIRWRFVVDPGLARLFVAKGFIYLFFLLEFSTDLTVATGDRIHTHNEFTNIPVLGINSKGLFKKQIFFDPWNVSINFLILHSISARDSYAFFYH